MAAGPLLAVENLRLTEPVRGQKWPRTLFASASFSLEPGEHLAVVVPTVGAATALARAVALLDRPAAGRVWFAGADVTRAGGARLRGLRRELQYVGGEARRALSPRLSLAQVIAEPLQVHRLGSEPERRERVAAIAAAWGLNAYLLGLRPGALSAGLCLRAALARALVLSPRLLVGAGLVDHLEPQAAPALLARLTAACRSAGTALLWITPGQAPALTLARTHTDRVLVLEDDHQPALR